MATRETRSGGTGRRRPIPVVRAAVTPRRCALVSCALAVGLLLGAVPVAGAARPGRSGAGERGRPELERTDQVIRRAADSIGRCPSEQARALLRRSRETQEEAWRLFNAAAPRVQAERVLALTRRARVLAVDAIEACQAEAGTPESLRAMLDSTAELLREAEEAIPGGSHPWARRLLEAGRAQLDRAREAYRAGDHQRAITLGGAARALVQRAGQRAGARAGSAEASRIDMALDRTEVLLAEIRLAPGFGADPQVAVLLDRASHDLARGRELAEEGRARAAWRHVVMARGSAFDALWSLHRVPRAEAVRNGVDLVARLLEEVEPEIRASGAADAIRLMEEARQRLDAARRSLREERPADAAREARDADRLLRRAADRAGR